VKHWLKRLGGRSQDGPMDCHQVGELLQHYLDDELDETRSARIAEHLEDCRRCGLELEAYEQIKSSLASRRPEVPADSVERLREFGRRLAQGEEPSNT
jgi:anti-sigma factor RsiW